MYCFNCGQQLPDESKFCSCCGTRICDNSKFDNESENVINNTPMSDDDVKISGDFSETSKKFFGVVDETKYNEIIGTSYQFSRNIFLGIDKKTHVRFDENEIVCGLFRTKSFKYDDVKEIYGKECFNVGELSCGIICGISGIFLIICMLLTGTDYLWPILIYTVVGFFSFLFAKNYVVTIVDSSNKKLTIKMSKKDGSRDDFIDSLKKITHTNELSVENPSKAKNIFIIAVSVILALSVEFLVVKDSFVSEFNARIDLNSSGSYQDKYVVPIKNYILGCEQNRYPRYLDAYTPYYAKFLDEKYAALTNNENGEMYLNELYKSMLTKYGEDFKITYDIISEIQAPREVLDKYAEDYIKADFAEEGTVFSDGYNIKVRFTVSGIKETKQYENELQLLELDGKWYMMDLINLID